MTKTIFEIRETIEGLKKERDRLIERGKKLSLFSAFDREYKETVRPEYDYDLTKEAVTYIVNTKVAECGDMTILEALLYVDELGEKEERLYAMSTHQEMERKNNPYRPEYEYINYDKSRVEEEYKKTKAELERIKMCVDFYIFELSSNYET